MSVVKPLSAVLLILGVLLGSAVTAQQEMGAEELERYIEKQKAALERVKKNREVTEEKARKAREALAEREKKRALIEEKVEALCQEREAVEAGTYDDCIGKLKD